jgi:hypothetical protein
LAACTGCDPPPLLLYRLPYPALPYPALPYPALPCPAEKKQKKEQKEEAERAQRLQQELDEFKSAYLTWQVGGWVLGTLASLCAGAALHLELMSCVHIKLF